jgi:hypothetical protein
MDVVKAERKRSARSGEAEGAERGEEALTSAAKRHFNLKSNVFPKEN